MFYLGCFNKDTKLFNKNIGEQVWNELKQKYQYIEDYKSLKYYTLDHIITKNLNDGQITVEKPQIKLIHSLGKLDNKLSALEIDSQIKKVAIFPVQLEYFNKQIYHTEVCQSKYGIVLFSKYIEKGTTYYEMASNDLKALSQLSSSSSSSS